MKIRWMIFLIVLLAGSFLIPNEAFSAWTQAKGHAYNQLTYSYYTSKNKFTTLETKNDVVSGVGKIRKVKVAGFKSTSVTYYGEYGITDILTVFTAVPWKWTKSDDTIKYSGSRGPSGIGDIDFGLRYSLSKNLLGTGVLMSAQGAVKIPKAYEYKNPLEHLSLGDGQYDTTLALLFGRGLGKGYAILNVGYKYRFKNEDSYYFTNAGEELSVSFKPSDQIKVRIDGGYSLTSKLSLRGDIDWTKSVGNASVSDNLLGAYHSAYGGLEEYEDNVLIRDTLALEQDVLSLGVALAYSITPKIQTVLSYDVDVGGVGMFRTKDAGKGASYSLAMVYMY